MFLVFLHLNNPVHIMITVEFYQGNNYVFNLASVKQLFFNIPNGHFNL